MDILKEAHELYALGWGVHWIKPNSKAPVKAGWSGPQRDPWDVVAKEYHQGYGLGVRLGESSKVSDGYLANIDVDIKSSETRHREEALQFLEAKFPNLINHAPIVKTGYGLRLFVKTKTPLKSGKLGASSEECVVYMPTADVSKQQLLAVEKGKITKEQLDKGYRIRPAWEVEFMSSGKQVVLPPSIHPETKRPYVWERGIIVGVPPVHINGHLKSDVTLRKPQTPFNAVEVDLKARGVPQRTIAKIESGEGVEDRSAALLGVAIALLRAGLSDEEVLSVLTNRDYFLGEVAYEHRHTDSQSAAAAWIRDYTLRKAREETNAARAFEAEVEVTPLLDDEAAKKQTAELLGETLTEKGQKDGKKAENNWRSRLDKTEKGKLRGTLKNIVLILENAVSPSLFKRDLFTNRDFYAAKSPWGGVVGEALTDDDAVKIKHWLAERFHVEPSVAIVFEAMILIAGRNSFHPVRDELKALPQWDGVERLDTWLLKNFEAKGPPDYLAQVLRKWLVASVKRTFEPGAKFDWMIIFEGPQGIGKSMFGAILFGQKYFADWLPKLEDKDAALGLQGKRCVEFGELDQLRRNEVETIKAFVTRQVDNVRPPYGRRSIEIYRQCVFFGSTNKEHYLKDDTGNRRFNPVVVGALDFGALIAEREQLWAEALFIYQNGLEPILELEGAAKAFAIGAQRDKLVPDDATHMADDIFEFFHEQMAKPEEERFNFHNFKLKQLFEGFGPLKIWKADTRGLMFAAKALNLLKLRGLLFKKIESMHGNFWKMDT